MTQIDKPSILERLILALYTRTPKKLLDYWPVSVMILHSRESLRKIRLNIAENRRRQKGRKLRVTGQLKSTNKKGK